MFLLHVWVLSAKAFSLTVVKIVKFYDSCKINVFGRRVEDEDIPLARSQRAHVPNCDKLCKKSCSLYADDTHDVG
jgi:hypothetical protein